MLKKNYRIRGTVRNLEKDENKTLFELDHEASTKLELVEADLLKKEDWPKALEGVNYLIHVASPCSIVEPKDPNDLINPAIEGVNNVLTGALEAGVEKIVMTSSTTAVAYGIGNETEGLKYDESNWSPDDLKV